VFVGELPGQNERVRLREEDERVVDHPLVARLEIVVAQTPIAGHVDPEHQQVTFPGNAGVDDSLDDGHRDAYGRRGLHGLEDLFVEAPFRPSSLAARSCRRYG
jgi:hypothetical protein